MIANRLRDWLNANLGPFYQSFALEGEDMILRSFFGEKRNGFYIDIGANDPYRQSNTAYFYLRGWTGINIDATAEVIEDLNEDRKDDINIKALISDETKKKTLYKFNDSALNTTEKKLANEYSKLAQYNIMDRQILTPNSLKLILNKNLKNNRVIDFMSIDVEGHEMGVLKSNDWKNYRPKVIVCESLNIKSLKEALGCEVYRYLSKKGYSCFAKTSTNLFFVDNE
jgi:FkbM family methyltransferase